MNRKTILTTAVALILSVLPMSAQKVSIGTNILDYADFITLNLDSSIALGQHWSLGLEAKLNPFMFNRGDEKLVHKQQSYAVGGRWWAWHTWSGWWTGAQLRYQEYNWGGVISAQTREGDRVGASLSAGYAYMLGPHLNLDFGLGFFAGRDWFTVYSCPTCGVKLEEGSRAFILPDKVMVAISYVF